MGLALEPPTDLESQPMVSRTVASSTQGLHIPFVRLSSLLLFIFYLIDRSSFWAVSVVLD